MAIELQVHVGTLCLYLGVPCRDSIFKVPTSYLHVKDVLMIFSACFCTLSGSRHGFASGEEFSVQ